MKLHYGCGLSAGEGWFNCDASPTLRLQRLPGLGLLFRKWLPPRFPDNIHYGDIVSGMNIAPDSCEAIYCAHVLEHLAFEDFRKAIKNSFIYLKPGGLFRLVLPDFDRLIAAYQKDTRVDALSEFMAYSHLGRKCRERGIKGMLKAHLGNLPHLWMWNEKSLRQQLEEAGFKNIRPCQYGDASDSAFMTVEIVERFFDALAFECSK